MLDRSAVLQSVYQAVDSVNEQLPPQDAILKTATALLYGAHGPLDSLGLISLIFAVEKQLEVDFGRTVSLTAESAAANTNGIDPFQSIATLVDWLMTLLATNQAAA